MNTRTITFAALATLAFAGAAQAYQGEQSPLPPAPFQSTLTRAQVQVEARQPLHISNGGTGAMGLRTGNVERAGVRATAVEAAREGSANYGKLGMPM
ncbi:DUF4148 domain-containing protein [Variovorax sp. PBL-E5]|uniref:DUF4148 domain-containing protein n=1 Tax=Variovorax sp. PBL-E5 TaxID=434014 RepID=UPI001316C823|nr:DUF4148 domain-containing protein [Variovorax sp. PBL-E5]VTU36649.1 hypothetical protein E5CHR_04370 [Variovorax sp. PBL-E5]